MKQTKQAIFIMSDTTRPDFLKCYGNEDMISPNIDRLADEGMLFSNAYTTQPVCGPARSAIFTGLYPHSNGAWGNSMSIGDNVKTIGQRLNDEGIRCAYIGKWHLDGGDYFGLGRCPEGWDPEYWYDMKMYLDELEDPERRFWSRQSASAKDGGVQAEDTFAYRVTERARDFIERYKDEDFLLVISYDEPHGPSLCPEPFASMYEGYNFPVMDNVRDDLSNKPSHQRAWAGPVLEEDRTNYSIQWPLLIGSNSFMDHETGRVMEAIDEHLDDETLTIFTSDHGDAMGSHRLFAKGPCVYWEIAQVPLIYRLPARIPSGTIHEGPGSHIDFVPTLMEFFGVPVLDESWLDGLSIWPTLDDPEVKVRDYAFIEFGRYEVDHDGFGGFQPMRAIFDGRYKLAVHLLSEDELYDIEEDPAEMNNLILDENYGEIRDNLHDELLDWMNESRDPFRGYYWERRPWRKDSRPASWDYTAMTRQRQHKPYEPRQLDYGTGLPMYESTRVKDRSQAEQRAEAEIVMQWLKEKDADEI